MRISSETADEFESFVDDNIDGIVALVNDARDRLGSAFDEDVDAVDEDEVRDALAEAIEDDDTALNAAALYKVGVSLDVRNDYAGFIVDELVGRKLAATVAGNDPERTLAEATFHYIDVHSEEVLDGDTTAGEDDVLAGVAAGVQTRLPGWDWQEGGGPAP